MSDVTSTPSRPGSPSASVVGIAADLPTARPYRFTWDPSSRRPGPESVSGTTEGRGVGDYISGNHAHPYGVLNTSSTNLTLSTGVLPAEWSCSRHGFHAISTVLNNPHKRQAPPKAHSSLPAVPPADLPRVRRKDFDSYLKAITPEWTRYEKNSQLGRDGQAQIDAARFVGHGNDSNGDGDGDDEVDDDPSSLHLRAAMVPLSPLHGKTIPPLNSVPSIFFQPGFNLADPSTFATVTEQDVSHASPQPSTSFQSFSSHEDTNNNTEADLTDPLSLSHSLPLLEKFSHYADTVEQHLVREISIRSTSFFAALTNLRELQSESSQCLDRIVRLRSLLLEVDEGTAKKGLELVRKEGKWKRVGRVKEGVALVGRVVEMTGVARGLVNAGQWGEALGVVEEIEGFGEGVGDHEMRVDEGKKGKTNGNGNRNPNPLSPTLEEQEEDEDEHQKEERLDENTIPTPQLEKISTKKSSLPNIPISQLQAFSALPSHLRALTMEIAASLSAELVAILKNDLESRIESRPVGTGDRVNGSAVTGGGGGEGGDSDQGLKDRLKPLLLNLVRTKGLKEGMLSWREVVLLEVRGVIKRKLPGFEAEDDDGGNTSSEARVALANHLRSMPQAEFMILIQSIYWSLLNGIERLKAQGTVIEELLESLKPEIASSSKPPSQGFPSVSEDLYDILCSAAELANTLAAKVISYRNEQHAALEFVEFLSFFNDSWAFVVRCEVVCRRMIVGLRGTVVGQAKLFLQSFHQIRISRSAKLVEDEVWNPSEVSPALQHIANVLVDSAVKDAPELFIKSEDAIFSPVRPGGFLVPATPATGSVPPSPNVEPGSAPPMSAFNPARRTSNGTTTGTGNSKHLKIEDRSYFLVSATADVLMLLLDYLRVIVNLSMLTTDTMSRVIEFLKAFNSRTCQVVLGAGAMRSAGLKNITAKHLALASQSLSIVFELIPYVRETFRRHLSQKQAVMLVEFDKLKRDYQEHQNEIHAKLIAIMGDRLNAHIKTLQSLDWKESTPEGSVNNYMELLVKETVTLHKVLSRYLAPPIVEYVMSQVFAAINHRLSEEYGKIELPSQQAKNRLIADAKYLHHKFGALKNVGAPVGMLETFVAEKTIPRTNAQLPARSNTISANQRLRGLLAGKASLADKALPEPGRAPTPPVPPPADKPQSQSQAQHSQLSQLLSPALTTGSTVNSLGIDASMSGSNLSLAMSPPIEEAAMNRFQVFKQQDLHLPSSHHNTEPLQRQEQQPPEREGRSSTLPLSMSPPNAERGSDTLTDDAS